MQMLSSLERSGGSLRDSSKPKHLKEPGGPWPISQIGPKAKIRLDDDRKTEVAMVSCIWCQPSDWEVTDSIPTMEAFFRSPPKTPSTGSRPRKRTRERLYKP
ncbi:hypothetical protein DPMN_050699 [Dreissena polymorpha]|uniref:Uncharacterized protein n=1 Tax=Dreissena polymorpha TaxID=45954 RepID=A0A9D4HLJ3_DREPO|nr:hypothetical protein DPMN_050699 [Dreissena polymorpha]